MHKGKPSQIIISAGDFFMKRELERWILAWILLLLLPWAVSLCWRQKETAETGKTVPVPVETVMAETEIIERGITECEIPEMKNVQPADRKILMEQDGVYTYRNLEDYLPGVVFSQTEPGTELEALKCQAVIARTYICRLMEERDSIDEKELNLPDLSGRLGTSDETVKALALCEQAVRETNRKIMIYEDQCILPLFHKISAGRTRTGDTDFPYLASVQSSYDRQADGYWTEVSWSPAEFAKKMGMDLGLSAENMIAQIQIIQKDEAGYVQKMKVGSKILNGEEVQYALELPSASFSIYRSNEKLCARAAGTGHGYGLSQAGARAMAREGWEYEEILHYYYKNISIVSE